jgi:ribosomal subunit interface protein
MNPSITYRGVEPTNAIEAYVRKRAERLDRSGTTVHSCRVVVEGPPKHKVHGGHYAVRVEVGCSAGDFVIDRAPGDEKDAEDLYAAIDAAFDRALRRLHDEVGRASGSAERAHR